MPQTIFERVLEISREQDRTLEEPCLELGCSMPELEQRLNRLDRVAVEEVSKWLGISYYSFFVGKDECDPRLLWKNSARRLWDK